MINQLPSSLPNCRIPSDPIAGEFQGVIIYQDPRGGFYWVGSAYYFDDLAECQDEIAEYHHELARASREEGAVLDFIEGEDEELPAGELSPEDERLQEALYRSTGREDRL